MIRYSKDTARDFRPDVKERLFSCEPGLGSAEEHVIVIRANEGAKYSYRITDW